MKINNGSNEYQKAIDFLEKGCKCGCSSRIPKEQFAELRESFHVIILRSTIFVNEMWHSRTKFISRNALKLKRYHTTFIYIICLSSLYY